MSLPLSRARLAHRIIGIATWLLVPGVALSAQTITLRLGDSAQVVVAPGAGLTVPLTVDLSAAGSLGFASMQASMSWSAARLRLDSIRGVPASGFTLTANQTNATNGTASLSMFSAQALAATGPVARAYFTAAAAGGTRVQLTPIAAGDPSATNILANLRLRPLAVCVADGTKWGDVTDDGAVNILDAQQIARYTVGFSVLNPTAMTARGDVTADGTTNIIDAQQIARYTVDLPAAARIGAAMMPSPRITSLSVAPNAQQSLPVGSRVTLTATPRDSTGADISGCVAVTFTSSNPAVATVSVDGLVTVVGVGSSTITAAAGGVSQAVAVVGTSTAPTSTMGGRLAVGYAFSCRLTAAGAAFCWGDNESGQLGDSSTTQRLAEVRVRGGRSYVALTAGSAHACALTSTGQAYCWGNNGGGQLGLGVTSTFSSVPVAVTGSHTFVQMVASSGGTCGLTATGSTYCWGNGPSTPELVSGGYAFTRLMAGMYAPQTCGVTAAALAYCWDPQQLPTLQPGASYSAIAVGNGSRCGISAGTTTSGQLFCWGRNWGGQLGDGTQTDRAEPTAVLGSRLYQAVSTSTDRTCALTTTGAAFCWGTGYLGGPNVGPGTPVAVTGEAASYAEITTGGQHNCALATTDRVYCWGGGTKGQLGDGTGLTRDTPTAILRRDTLAAVGTVTLTPSPTTVSVGGTRTLTATVRDAAGAVLTGRELRWSSSRPDLVVVSSAGVATGLAAGTATLTAECEGVVATVTVTSAERVSVATTSSALTVGQTTPLTVTVRDSTGAVVTGSPITWRSLNPAVATVSSTGVVTAVATGRVGIQAVVNGVATGVALTITGSTTPVAGGRLAVGYAFSCRLTAAGAAFCWGDNESGQLGDSSTTQRLAEVRVRGGRSYVALTAGSAHACALTSTGQAYCWGNNGGGQLGLGVTSTFSSVPVAVTGSHTFVQMVASSGGTCGLTATGSTYCWGNGPSTPELVSGGYAFTRLMAGMYAPQTCGVTAAALAYCWDPQQLPTLQPGASYSAIAVGNGSRCGISAGTTTSGQLFCWGRNWGGQLGDGTQTDRAEPTAVLGSRLYQAVSTSTDRTCALTTTGAAFCWGTGYLGGPNVGPGTPVAVTGEAASYAEITTGGQHNCALATTDRVYCWGGGTKGQLGDGTGLTRDTPTAILRRDTLAAVGTVTLTPSPTTVSVGGTRTLTATVRDAAGAVLTGRELRWSSSRPDLVVVSSAGVATGLAAGTATLTAECEGVVATVTVTSAERVSVATTSSALTVGQTTPLTVTVRDSTGAVVTGSPITWRSLNPAVATVSSTGVVTAVATGRVGIQAVVNGVATGVALTITGSTTPVAGGRLAVGYAFSCRLTAAGAAFCWGDNESGQLGDSSTTQRLAEVRVRGGRSYVALTAGSAHACALTSTGQAYCWGNNGGGQLGLGVTSTFSSVPVAVTGSHTFVQMVASSGGTCGLTATGSTYCWGNGPSTPELVSGGYAFTRLMAGMYAPQTCGVTAAALAYCWDPQQLPTLQPGASYSAIAVGNGSRCGISAGTTTSGQLFCWGRNWGGQLGDGTQTDRAEPTAVLGSRLYQAVSTSTDRTCALTTTGAAFCWGTGYLGGPNVGPGTPVAVTGEAASYAEITTGGQHNCALATTDRVYCWGGGTKGQLGDGTGLTRDTPTAILRRDTLAAVGTVTLTPSPTTVSVGGTRTLTATVRDAAGAVLTGRELRWSSSRPDLVVVSSAGVATGLAAGTATLTAECEGVIATVSITISP